MPLCSRFRVSYLLVDADIQKKLVFIKGSSEIRAQDEGIHLVLLVRYMQIYNNSIMAAGRTHCQRGSAMAQVLQMKF